MKNEAVMSQTDFLSILGDVKNSYKWSYVNNKLVGVVTRGKNRGIIVNPITAIALNRGIGYFKNTKRETMRAAKKLGISNGLASAVYSDSNRGHAQIVRGKMIDVITENVNE